MTAVVTGDYSISSPGIENFIFSVISQLDLQGQEPVDEFLGGHPDPIIRRCYRAASRILNSSQGNKYLALISDVFIHRSGIVDTHFVNLWFRSLQYIFRSRNDLRYLTFDEDRWFSYFASEGIKDIKEVKALLCYQNTATHVMARYRSLAAALRIIDASTPGIDFRIADIGCSLGLGLKASLVPGFLLEPPFVDNTPGKVVQNNLSNMIKKCSLTVGVDVRIPSVDWVKACNYPSRYEEDSQAIDKAINDLSFCSFPIKLVQTDILNRSIVRKLSPGSKKVNLIYSSMSLYELSKKEQEIVSHHFTQALDEGGYHIDFAPKQPDNWFLGNKTTVSIKENGLLSPPLEWLLWKDSRCCEVDAGADFNQVTAMLSSRR